MRAMLVAMLVACSGSSAPPASPPPVTGSASGSGSGLAVAVSVPPANTCQTDDDCQISCANRGQCCNFPYCESADSIAAANDARQYNEAHCTPADQQRCPQIGGRITPNYTVEAHCKNSQCVAIKIPRGSGMP